MVPAAQHAEADDAHEKRKQENADDHSHDVLTQWTLLTRKVNGRAGYIGDISHIVPRSRHLGRIWECGYVFAWKGSVCRLAGRTLGELLAHGFEVMSGARAATSSASQRSQPKSCAVVSPVLASVVAAAHRAIRPFGRVATQ